MPKLESKHLIILASTFPRWANDTVPAFVLHFAQSIRQNVASVTVISPHYPGAKIKEVFEPLIHVRRFRYAYPSRFENIAYGQFKKTRFYPIKAMLYAASEFWLTLITCLRNKPVIINAHWIIPQGFVAVMVAPLFGARVVVSVHGADVFTLNGKYMRKIKRFTLQRADLVIANSSATQSACAKLWSAREYPVVPMGIDAHKFSVRRSKRQSDVFEVIFVGRFVAVKGIPYLCEAMKLLSAKHKNVHLTLIGDGQDRPNLEAYVSAHALEKVITFTGWVQPDELPDRLAAADVFVGPSIEDSAGWTEALGLVFAEASAAGLPVIGTNVGGIRDIVQDGKTGLIVPQQDPQALCDALEYIYKNREQGRKMGDAGLRYVQDNFSWDSVAKRYIELIQAIS